MANLLLQADQWASMKGGSVRPAPEWSGTTFELLTIENYSGQGYEGIEALRQTEAGTVAGTALLLSSNTYYGMPTTFVIATEPYGTVLFSAEMTVGVPLEFDVAYPAGSAPAMFFSGDTNSYPDMFYDLEATITPLAPPPPTYYSCFWDPATLLGVEQTCRAVPPPPAGPQAVLVMDLSNTNTSNHFATSYGAWNGEVLLLPAPYAYAAQTQHNLLTFAGVTFTPPVNTEVVAGQWRTTAAIPKAAGTYYVSREMLLSGINLTSLGGPDPYGVGFVQPPEMRLVATASAPSSDTIYVRPSPEFSTYDIQGAYETANDTLSKDFVAYMQDARIFVGPKPTKSFAFSLSAAINGNAASSLTFTETAYVGVPKIAKVHLAIRNIAYFSFGDLVFDLPAGAGTPVAGVLLVRDYKHPRWVDDAYTPNMQILMDDDQLEDRPAGNSTRMQYVGMYVGDLYEVSADQTAERLLGKVKINLGNEAPM